MRKMILMMVLFLLPISTAFNLNTTCLDNSTVYEEIQVNYYLNGSLDSTEKWNQTSHCIHGCYNGVCVEKSNGVGVNMGLGILFAGIFLGFFGLKMDQSSKDLLTEFILSSMKGAFIDLSLLLIAVSFAVFTEISEINGMKNLSTIFSVLYLGSIIVWLLASFLILISFTKSILSFKEALKYEKTSL